MSFANHDLFVVLRAMGWFYNLVFPLIGLILMAGSLYYAREQVRLMKAAASANQRARLAAAASNRPWWKSWQLAVMAVLMALTWVPFVYGLVHPSDILEFEDQYAWGTLPSGEAYLTVGLKSTKPDKKLILVALHYNGLGDFKDQSGIQKSLPYDYTAGLLTMVVDPDQRFRNETAAGMKTINFLLLEVPSNISRDQFSTVRQAISIGGKLVITRASTPK
jgi:hypothetical protein